MREVGCLSILAKACDWLSIDVIKNEKLEITDWTVASITESEDRSEKWNGDESWKNLRRGKWIGECTGILKKSRIIHSEKSDLASELPRLWENRESRTTVTSSASYNWILIGVK